MIIINSIIKIMNIKNVVVMCVQEYMERPLVKTRCLIILIILNPISITTFYCCESVDTLVYGYA